MMKRVIKAFYATELDLLNLSKLMNEEHYSLKTMDDRVYYN